MHRELLRTARLEDSRKTYASLDLDLSRGSWSTESAAAIMHIFQGTMYNHVGSVDMELAERKTVLLCPRMHDDSSENEDLLAGLEARKPEMQPVIQSGRDLRMHVEVLGLLDTIIFKDNEDANLALADGYVEIDPKAYGLNFCDVMLVMGMLPGSEQEMGIECAGVVARISAGVSSFDVGDRVCALCIHGHYASRVRLPWTSMSFETEATIGLAFINTYGTPLNAYSQVAILRLPIRY
ncbi:hypothetical protein GGS24DRAFT_446468 [Hypoxylon argillaceum]|nr:hypothetical protein GGS24DRAFT_446468 [Hypoxylon argillaceum]